MLSTYDTSCQMKNAENSMKKSNVKPENLRRSSKHFEQTHKLGKEKTLPSPVRYPYSMPPATIRFAAAPAHLKHVHQDGYSP